VILATAAGGRGIPTEDTIEPIRGIRKAMFKTMTAVCHSRQSGLDLMEIAPRL